MATSEDFGFDEYKSEWLEAVQAGNPSTTELGRRFAHKLLTQWLDIDEASDDLIYCDGSGDGGIDIAYLERRDIDEDSEAVLAGDTWYVVQSKYGKAFQGANTLLEEARKIINTLQGKQQNLSSLAEGLTERLRNFQSQASDQDRIILVFATEYPFNSTEHAALQEVRLLGRTSLGNFFDVQSISIETMYQRSLEQEMLLSQPVKVPIHGKMAGASNDLLVGVVTLPDIFAFLKSYRDITNDLDQIYDRNVRRFLGNKRKVNRAIQDTLRERPERFGLYNNGITIVVNNFNETADGHIDLIEPYIVNGCQTTRAIWDVCYQRLEAGGHGHSEELEEWKDKASQGVVVTKIVRVGNRTDLEQTITRYTNSQNAVREQDFLALTSNFREWARQMENSYGFYLEIQRGGWDSRRALQKQRPNMPQLEVFANAFDLVKVFGAGWLGEAGTAFRQNTPFLPDGAIFKRIMEPIQVEDSFGVEDLYASFLLKKTADEIGFGRGSIASRRQTRFLFYMIAMELLTDILTRMRLQPFNQTKTKALLKLFNPGNDYAKQALMDAAIEFVDSYLTEGTDNSVFEEPAFRNTFNNDLNGFLKWDKIGKNEESCPRFRTQISVIKSVMGQKLGGQPSTRDIIMMALSDED